MSRLQQVGFSQRVRLEWLEHTAQFVLAGTPAEEITRSLQDLLKDRLSIGGRAERGNREKVISILQSVWVTVSPELRSLRDAGLDLVRSRPKEEHIVIHWGMCMAAYPFFGVVGAEVGRLLRLQGNVAAAQVQRRVRERYGERDTVSRAARRVLRTFVDWCVLAESDKGGVYDRGTVLPVVAPEMIAWLLSATLHARANGAAQLQSLMEAPSLFPFRLKRISAAALVAQGGLDVIRHGLDDELLKLTTGSSAGSAR